MAHNVETTQGPKQGGDFGFDDEPEEINDNRESKRSRRTQAGGDASQSSLPSDSGAPASSAGGDASLGEALFDGVSLTLKGIHVLLWYPSANYLVKELTP